MNAPVIMTFYSLAGLYVAFVMCRYKWASSRSTVSWLHILSLPLIVAFVVVFWPVFGLLAISEIFNIDETTDKGVKHVE